MRKHNWTYEEDLLCCEKYWEYLIKNARNRDFEKMAEEIKAFFPQVELEILKGKLTHVRELMRDYNLYDGMEEFITIGQRGRYARSEINPRSDYTLQLNRAFLQVLAQNGLEERLVDKKHLVIDTVEFTDEYKKILPELEILLEDTRKNWIGLGACHIIWSVKEDILREKFNIVWKCPSALNPDVLFD